MHQSDDSAMALIPARGGSKGIPGKNLKDVGGVPLVARSIRAAQASAKVTRVVVSTDDDAIAAVSLEYGAEVVRRPAVLANDTASSESALLHALDLFAADGSLPSSIVFLQCTSPFTTGQQIDKVLTALQPKNVNSAFAVAPWHGFLWRDDGRGINHDPQQARQRRQDLEPSFLETGAIYAMKTAAFLNCGSRFCAPWRPVVLEDSGPEIDTTSDLELCRNLAVIEPS
ncbi:cytidylyltransferase domain-containing protein [Synechococcus sp. CC9616]|uniref:acylneuraminate cytidylyltransferase family protein n=1 Tax=Synechococcus sp. CC9616 TaxID=110663 RepID=UPI0005672F32|nr:acylneuraminate cytidylyltransferase family protein [Synechococcus sp. CC9616]